ncbi:hypothetical protein MAP00_001196 [Monascus purpureus]|nr:hypothetical protein MAP00_001196 [Monascus purpureus]
MNFLLTSNTVKRDERKRSNSSSPANRHSTTTAKEETWQLRLGESFSQRLGLTILPAIYQAPVVAFSPQTKQLTLRPLQLHCGFGHSRGR